MSDTLFTAIGRKGVRVTEDADALTAYFERGPEGNAVHAQGVGAPYQLTVADIGITKANVSAGAMVAYLLPLDADAPIGTPFAFYSGPATGSRVIACDGAKIANEDQESIVNGYIECLTLRGFLVLEKVAANYWVVRSSKGTWKIQTA